MKTIIASSISTGEVKVRIPNCTLRTDGTIWAQGDTIPFIVTAGLPDAAELTDRYKKLVASKRFSEIPPEHIAHIGDIRDIRIEWEQDYNLRPTHPAIAEKNRIQKDTEDNRITVHLSSRGWGDYSPVQWTGDRRRPFSEILVECIRLLSTGHDVDQPNQSPEEITSKITEEIRKSIDRQKQDAANAAELAATQVPENAIAAYQACRGNPENFPDDIDDPRYWLVNRYAAAIEHQGLGGTATSHKLAAEVREAAREEAAQYQGEA
jgi:hypothetical protein